MARKLPENTPPEIVREVEEKGGIDGLIEKIPDSHTLNKIAKLHHALSDPIRLKILCLLKVQDSCVCLIRAVVGISYSKLSYHLSILKKADLISGRKRGNYIIYSLTPLGREYSEGICTNK